jgi:hypothetical protein
MSSDTVPKPLDKSTPIIVRLTTGENLIGTVLEARVRPQESLLSRMSLLLTDCGTIHQSRVSKDSNDILYSVVKIMSSEVYIPLDKIVWMGVADDIARQYYERFANTIQAAATIESVAARELQAGIREEGEAAVFEVP